MAIDSTGLEDKEPLSRATGIATDDLAETQREEELRHNLERQIDHAIAEINANPAIDSQTKDKLVGSLRSLKNGLGLTPNLALVQNEINSTRASASFIATSNMLYGSLSVANQLAVNERVAAQFDAIRDGDIVAIGKGFNSAIYDELPPAMQKAVDEGTQAQLASPHGQKLLNALQEEQKKNPEAVKQELAEIATRKVFLAEQLKSENDPTRRALINQMLQSGSYNMPASAAFCEGLSKNAPVEQLREAKNHADRQFRTSVVGAMATARQVNATQIDNLISAAPEDMRESLRHNDGALAQYLIEKSNDITAAERKAVFGKLGKNIELTPREQEIRDIFTVMPTLSSTAAISGTLMRLGRAQDLEIRQNKGETLTAKQQMHVDNLRFIREPANGLVERAERLIGAKVDGAAPLNSPLFQSATNSRSSNLALATLTLAFTDQNGGIDKFQEFARRAEFAKSNGAPDEKATAYFMKYQDFISRSLINQPLDPKNPQQLAELTTALNEAGNNLASGKLQAFSSPTNLSFLDTADSGYEMRSSVFAASGQAFTAAYGGTKEIVDQLYKETRLGGADPTFVSIVRDIDTYRLQNDPSSEALINDVWLGKTPIAEVRAQLDIKIEEERSGMQEYAGYALSRTSDFQREVLDKNPNLKNADGSLNMDEVMKRVESNKAMVYDYYQDYLKVPIDELRKSPDPKLQHLAEVRALSELVSPMRSAHSLEHMTERSDALGAEIKRITDAGGKPAQHLLDDQRLITTIMEYNQNSATEQQRTEFNVAMRTFLMRDAYTAEKEAADANKSAGDRSNLVANTIALVEARLKDDPLYLRQPEHQSLPDAGVTHATTPPAAASTQTPLTAAEIAARKIEGRKGELDDLGESHLEDRIKKALGSTAMADVVRAFGQHMVGADGTKYNEGVQDNITVNELENALQAAAKQLAGKTLSSKEVVALFDTVDKNGKKDGLLSIEEIVAGLKKNGQLTSVAGGEAAATAAAPAAVPAIAGPAPATGR